MSTQLSTPKMPEHIMHILELLIHPSGNADGSSTSCQEFLALDDEEADICTSCTMAVMGPLKSNVLNTVARTTDSDASLSMAHISRPSIVYTYWNKPQPGLWPVDRLWILYLLLLSFCESMLPLYSWNLIFPFLLKVRFQICRAKHIQRKKQLGLEMATDNGASKETHKRRSVQTHNQLMCRTKTHTTHTHTFSKGVPTFLSFPAGGQVARRVTGQGERTGKNPPQVDRGPGRQDRRQGSRETRRQGPGRQGDKTGRQGDKTGRQAKSIED